MSPAVAIKNGGVPVIRRQNERLLGRRRPARGGRLYGRYVAQRIASFILNKALEPRGYWLARRLCAIAPLVPSDAPLAACLLRTETDVGLLVPAVLSIG